MPAINEMTDFQSEQFSTRGETVPLHQHSFYSYTKYKLVVANYILNIYIHIYILKMKYDLYKTFDDAKDIFE